MSRRGRAGHSGKSTPSRYQRLDRRLRGALESALAQHYPQYQDRLLTIYNGIDFERYSSGRRGTIPGVSENDTVLLCVTALNFSNKSKGISLVMDAFGQVHAHRKAVKLVIAAKSSNPRQQQWAGRGGRYDAPGSRRQ